MKVKKMKLDEIKPYWKNPRQHTEANLKAIRESIKKFGYVAPIIVDKEGVIIAGHGRYEALKELGYEEVDVIEVDLPPEKAKEYRIADNRIAEMAEWDIDMLLSEIREIGESDFMEMLFPTFTDFSIEPSSGGSDLPDLTPKEKEEDDIYIEIKCPKCGEKFQVRRDDICWK